jgi:hypothetical protein
MGSGVLLAVESGGTVTVENLAGAGGSIEVTPPGTLQVGSVTGSVQVTGSLAPLTGDTIVIAGGGVLAGLAIDGALYNQGTFAPGGSPGIVPVTGGYTQDSAGILQIEIGGIDEGDYDRLVVSGDVALDGTLELILCPPSGGGGTFVPREGDLFDVLDWSQGIGGAFSSIDISGAPLAQGLSWNVESLYVDGVLSVVRTTIPEPSSLVIGFVALGTACLVGRRPPTRGRRAVGCGPY